MRSCVSLFSYRISHRCIRSLGFSLACVCSLNNKYHINSKPRKKATKPDSIWTSSHEANAEVLLSNIFYGVGIRVSLRSNERHGFFHLVKRVYRYELLVEWMWMWIVQKKNVFHQSAFYIFLRGEKYVTYKKCFIKSNRLNVRSYTLKSNNQHRRRDIHFCWNKVLCYAQSEYSVGMERKCRHTTVARVSAGDFCYITYDRPFASKSIFFIKKQGRSIYIDDDDREIIWVKPLSQCPSL